MRVAVISTALFLVGALVFLAFLTYETHRDSASLTLEDVFTAARFLAVGTVVFGTIAMLVSRFIGTGHLIWSSLLTGVAFFPASAQLLFWWYPGHSILDCPWGSEIRCMTGYSLAVEALVLAGTLSLTFPLLGKSRKRPEA